MYYTAHLCTVYDKHQPLFRLFKVVAFRVTQSVIPVQNIITQSLMADSKTIKKAFERNVKLLTIKPSKGQYTTSTKVRLKNGTTCEVEHKQWTFTADVGKQEGGNDEGPGPGILYRASLGSCLAIGYALWAAQMDIQINHLEVTIEADVDARGNYGVDNIEPGYRGMRYTVTIDSPSTDAEIHEMIKKADDHSPILANFRKPMKIERTINIAEPDAQHSHNTRLKTQDS
jgi:uncharacterized OsmC-like protein